MILKKIRAQIVNGSEGRALPRFMQAERVLQFVCIDY